MRLLWEEQGFGMIGAFCVAAFALATSWFMLEGLLGLSGALSGLLALGAAIATLEGISRHHYEHRRGIRSPHSAPAPRVRASSAPRDELAARRRAA